MVFNIYYMDFFFTHVLMKTTLSKNRTYLHHEDKTSYLSECLGANLCKAIPSINVTFTPNPKKKALVSSQPVEPDITTEG